MLVLRLALLGLGVVTIAAPARAGCPAVCDIVLSPVKIEPARDCLKVQAIESTCNCGMWFDVENQCSAEVYPIDFEPGACGGVACVPLGSKGRARWETKLAADGKHEIWRDVDVAGTMHRISTTALVSNRGDNRGGCSVSSAPAGQVPLLLALGVVAGLARRRRARASR